MASKGELKKKRDRKVKNREVKRISGKAQKLKENGRVGTIWCYNNNIQ